jgi:hypothetical protein
LDYDYNPYDSPAVDAPAAPRSPAPIAPPLPRTTERTIFVPQLEAFSEEEMLRSDLPPPGPSPPADFLVKVLPPRQQQQQQQQQQQEPVTTERTFYQPNNFNRPQQPPTAPTISEESVQPFPRSLSYFDEVTISRTFYEQLFRQ